MRGPLGFDLRSLEVFVTMCGTHSMTAAANRLGMTQSAVSQTIRQLERNFGLSLIDRRKRPFRVTAAGEYVRQTATHLLHDAQSMPRAVRQFGKGLPPGLRIGLVDSLTTPFVPELLLRMQGPLSYLSVSAGLAHSLRVSLQEHVLDMVISNDAMDDIEGLVRHTILAEPYFVLIPSGLDLRTESIDLRRLSQQLPLVRWSARSHIGSEIERHLHRMGLSLPRKLEFDSSDALIGIVSAGLGWAVMTPLCLFNSKARLGEAQALPFPGPGFTRRLSLIARAGEIDSLALRVAQITRRILREKYLPEMEAFAPWLEGRIGVTS